MIFKRQNWQEHLDTLNWRQGEHVLIAAPTGSGKSVLAGQLAEKRNYVANFITKTKDPLFSGEQYKEWVRVTEWQPGRSPKAWENKVLLWPRELKTMAETRDNQKVIFRDALEDVFKRGGWCLVFDELHYLADQHFLNLSDAIAILFHMGRSNNVSLMALTQRPAWIPKIIYSSVSHAYIARTKDAADLKRLSDLAGLDPKKIQTAVSELPSRHDFLYVNPMGDHEPVIVNTRK